MLVVGSAVGFNGQVVVGSAKRQALAGGLDPQTPTDNLGPHLSNTSLVEALTSVVKPVSSNWEPLHLPLLPSSAWHNYKSTPQCHPTCVQIRTLDKRIFYDSPQESDATRGLCGR